MFANQLTITMVQVWEFQTTLPFSLPPVAINSRSLSPATEMSSLLSRVKDVRRKEGNLVTIVVCQMVHRNAPCESREHFSPQGGRMYSGENFKKYVDLLSTIYRTTRQNVSKNIDEYKEQYHQPAEPNRHLQNTPPPNSRIHNLFDCSWSPDQERPCRGL